MCRREAWLMYNILWQRINFYLYINLQKTFIRVKEIKFKKIILSNNRFLSLKPETDVPIGKAAYPVYQFRY